jgi:UDP-glucose 4-epimerase
LSINQLAERAIAAYGLRGHPIIRKPGRPGEQRRVQADISRAKAVLGWEPKTSFEAGLAETIRLGGDLFASAQPRPQAVGGVR